MGHMLRSLKVLPPPEEPVRSPHHRSTPVTVGVLLAALGTVAIAATVTPSAFSAAPTGPSTGPSAPARWLIIEATETGYLLKAGLQDSQMTITQMDDTLRIVDTGTKELQAYPASCRAEIVPLGVAATCDVPLGVDETHPMTLDIRPRLGDDHIDASTLSAAFDLSVLADAGHDVVLLGAGNDFVNGARGIDEVDGGPGDDWIRTGPGDDVLVGGDGDDKLVGDDGNDRVTGGAGDDHVGGGNGDDHLYADTGTDVVRCGSGIDDAHADPADKTTPDCESVAMTDR